MNIKSMNIRDLESYFNLVSKIREGVIMMARANNNMNTKEMRDINNQYNMILNEITSRLACLTDEDITHKKQMLNEEVAH